ncbi:MAG: hypothetical protein M1840_006102 [Geoglossum simile]|nr:MAG: hypothetical protein M1840_006102 [Geoglossum simile]
MSFWRKKPSARTHGETKSAPNGETGNARGGSSDSQRAKGVSGAAGEPYGLFVFQDQAVEGDVEKRNAVDLIAIHGLNGHFEKSWQATTPEGHQVNWLREFLPEQMPYARIMSYGYNSTVLFSKTEADIGTFAEQLLEDIMSLRARDSTRPIIFICHSLGGIVFKKAVVRAHERDRYSLVLKYIRGVAFFGTPHRGADSAYWCSIFSNLLKTASLGVHTQSNLPKDLELQSRALREISKAFVDRAKDLRIFSFYETDKMDFLNCRVVDEESAILGLPNEVPIAMNGNHKTICRFSENGQRYRKVWTNLEDMAVNAITQTLSKEERSYHQTLYTSDYQSHRDRNPSPVAGTCRWLLHHEEYRKWQQAQASSLLWLSADPGCGKSVLASFLIGHLASVESRIGPSETICYFFFKADNDQQRSPVHALSAILHQLYSRQPALLKHAFEIYQERGSCISREFHTLWHIFLESIEDKDASNIILILDGLDECEKLGRQQLLRSLSTFYSADYQRKHRNPKTPLWSLKTIVTSRPDNDIKTAFLRMLTVRLRGEDETEAISKDVELVVQASITDLVAQGLPSDFLVGLQASIIERADRTFLWTTMVIELLKDATERGASKKELSAILDSRDIDDVYLHLLGHSANPGQAKKLLHIVIAASRPLTLDEMNIALAVHPGLAGFKDLSLELKHPFENYVKSLCGHFVRIIRNSIYLVHQTAREFLLNPSALGTALPAGRWGQSISFPGANFVLLDACVEYLMLFSLEDAQETRSRFKAGLIVVEVSDFLEYAARYWPVHFQAADPDWEPQYLQKYVDLCDPRAQGFAIWFGKYCYHHRLRRTKLDIYDGVQDDESLVSFLVRPTHSTTAQFLGLDAIAERAEIAELETPDEDTSNLQDSEDLEQLLDELDPPDEMDVYGNRRFDGGNVRTRVKTRNYVAGESVYELESTGEWITTGADANLDVGDSSLTGGILIPRRPKQDSDAFAQPHTVSTAFLRHDASRVFRFLR